MHREPVISSGLAAIGYDRTNETLEIEFKRGTVYKYFGVPQIEYKRLMAASSRGAHFTANIRNRYPYKRIDRRRRRKMP